MNSIVCKPLEPSLELVSVDLPEHGRDNLITRIADTLNTWSQRSRQRKQLSKLDEHLLADIGVSFEDVWLEINKPFWKS